MLTKCILLIMVPSAAAFDLEGKVVKGEQGSIKEFPSAVFLLMGKERGAYVCGSSIVNQKILLTAAHCIEVCGPRCKNGAAFVGNENKRKGLKISVKAAMAHPDYSPYRVHNDIGLAVLENPIQLGKLVQRIAIYRNPRIIGEAAVAGWGLIDEKSKVHTDYLHHISQNVLTLSECRHYISSVPNGCFCTGGINSKKYASEGDSGSALVIRKFVQIGIVSYKRPDVSLGIVVYTNVSYFYDWIKEVSKKMYCNISVTKWLSVSTLTPQSVFLHFQKSNSTACGSSLITDQAVITAANCFDEIKYKDCKITVFLGSTIPQNSVAKRNVLLFTIHPRFNPKTAGYNLGITFFNQCVTFDNGLQKIPIIHKRPGVDEAVFTSGWGKEQAREELVMPNKLPDYSDMRHLKVSKQRIVSERDCQNITGSKMTPGFWCTISINGFHYHGDMGNGLVNSNKNLIGVVSFLVNDATVYADVMREQLWINDSIIHLLNKYCKDPKF